AAGSDAERAEISDAFASGLQTSQLVGAIAVFVGGVVAAALLKRAERSEKRAAGSGEKAAAE
ncbi:MFS transporter, partial [Streptomyces sp. NPDC054975]